MHRVALTEHVHPARPARRVQLFERASHESAEPALAPPLSSQQDREATTANLFPGPPTSTWASPASSLSVVMPC